MNRAEKILRIRGIMKEIEDHWSYIDKAKEDGTIEFNYSVIVDYEDEMKALKEALESWSC